DPGPAAADLRRGRPPLRPGRREWRRHRRPHRHRGAAMSMNRQVRRVGIVVVVLFLALFVQLNYLQVVKAHSLANNPRNVRAVVRDYAEPRGAILTSDGVVVARSVPVDDEFERLRTYPTGPLFAHPSGFFSFTLGATGVEDAYNSDLSG